VVGTQNLLDAALSVGVKRFVHCSSVGVLGEIHDPPANERSPYNPGDFYQYTKTEAERTVLAESERGSLPCVVFRPAGAYGPGDSRFLQFFKALKRGYFIMLGKGEITYQMVYIDDLVKGIRLCGTSEAAIGNTFILAAEEPVRLNDLVTTAARAVGSNGPRIRLPVAPIYTVSSIVEVLCKMLGLEPPIYRRRVDFFRKNRAFSIQKAKQELGFHPEIGLEDGIRRTVNWYESEGLL
jgi:nucleoside-diphosphate-sugar epimerase